MRAETAKTAKIIFQLKIISPSDILISSKSIDFDLENAIAFDLLEFNATALSEGKSYTEER